MPIHLLYIIHTYNMQIKKEQELKPKRQIIKQKCLIQNSKFKQWAEKKSWNVFHNSHYDWWTFPIDRDSGSYGSAYKVEPEDHEILLNDKQFISALRQNAILVCRSWDWNLEKGTNIKNPQFHQKWQRWPIRLYKMCQSLQIFQQNDLFKNAIKYGIILLKEYKKFTYGGKDLTPYFYQKQKQIKVNDNPYQQS